ncbi:MAG: serine acetyltransferase [Mucilaginibacter sp.]|nr:serine acetyltransferase [Mucilaginibacter sp.]
MNDDLYRRILERPVNGNTIPSNETIAGWALDVINLLFPEHARNTFTTATELKQEASRLNLQLTRIIIASTHNTEHGSRQVADEFFANLATVYEVLLTDIKAIFEGDPAAQSEYEVIRTYPGFYAICFYRIAHLLCKLKVPLIPRILTEHAHSKTGIDIHPAARIGEYFHIDHGTGIVIGETCTIGNKVKLYQGVTLGALSVRKELAGLKRHPTVENRVVIYSGATILGGDTVIGHDSVIGGNVWLTESIAPFSAVYHNPVVTVRTVTENI